MNRGTFCALALIILVYAVPGIDTGLSPGYRFPMDAHDISPAYVKNTADGILWLMHGFLLALRSTLYFPDIRFSSVAYKP
jgi:hypothetical protein